MHYFPFSNSVKMIDLCPQIYTFFIIKFSFANMKETGHSGYYYPRYEYMYVCSYSKWCLFTVEWHCRAAVFCSEVLKWC